MADHGQRSTSRMREQPLREAGHEGLRRQLTGRIAIAHGKLVRRRGPQTMAGEMEGDQTMKPGIVIDVIS
jgi:hypothetical protein